MHISSLPGSFSIGSFGSEAKRFVDFLTDAGFKVWQVLPFCKTDEYNSPYRPDLVRSINPYFIDLEILGGKGLITKRELDEHKQRSAGQCEFDFLRRSRMSLLEKAASRSGETGFIFNEFLRQWKEIKKYANTNGVEVIGDLPFYISPESVEVEKQPDLFICDKVAGVPPDYFNKNGQLWGNPLYNWNEMKKDGYRWWRERLKFMAEMFDMVRIDHFRAVESAWAVPIGEKTATRGEWIKGPGMELVRSIRETAGDTGIIAEDLGDITPEVEALVKESGFPGMRVFQFGFSGEQDNPHRPENYPENCVAYSGTHDNDTLRGFLPADVTTESVIEEIFASRANIVIFPIQDLLGLGSEARMNYPGRAEGNWGFRVTAEQMTEIDRKYFRKLSRKYSR